MGITGTGYGIRTERSRVRSWAARAFDPRRQYPFSRLLPSLSVGDLLRLRLPHQGRGRQRVHRPPEQLHRLGPRPCPACRKRGHERTGGPGDRFPAPSGLQAELAERIVGRVASVEKVRFANSGTEAVMMAVRGARAFTGREKIVKAEGGYNGMWEQVPISWPQDPYRAAMPEGVRELVRMVDYNDVGQLEAVMEEQGDEVAAIILEPVTGTGSSPGP